LRTHPPGVGIIVRGANATVGNMGGGSGYNGNHRTVVSGNFISGLQISQESGTTVSNAYFGM